MGLFSRNNKIDLIRQLLAVRVLNDPAAVKAGMTPCTVRQLKDIELMSAVEAMIVVIVETYFELERRGVECDDAIRRIDQHRASLGTRNGPLPTSLPAYVKFRIEIESSGPTLSDAHVEMCIHSAEHLFSYLDDKGEAAHSIKFAQHQQLEQKFERVMDIFAEYYEGGISEDQFYAQAETEIEAWIAVRNARRNKHAEGRFLLALREME